MSHKTKQILLIALLSLLITALFAASFTYARYYKETGVTGGKYDDTIEFVGANKYIVYSPEELVSAIENGYSYIEIGEGAEEPFVITDGVTDVSANLVLDINGHDLVRNSRNPLIDVQKNVSVVIVYDSKSSGSFYNPVGSLLQASGGTLTIATGEFTSGPKAEDYVTDVGTEEDYVKDTGTTEEGVSYSLGNYTVYYRDGYTPGADSPNRSGEYIDTGVEAKLPKIVPVVIDPEAKDRYGNIYFQKGIENNAYIKEDTFLIYTEETVDASEGTTVDFEPLCDVASCDFYYYYVTDTDGSGEDKTTTYAVIYGYNDVMAGAEQQITKEGFNESEDAIIDPATAVIWPYAAVRMTEGEAFIRGGTYTNQFGKAQSYGIYARGGDLAISGSNTTFSAIEDGVCVRCEKTTVDSTTYVPQLNISGTPQFFSVNNETIQVEDGDIAVSSGTATVKAKNSTGIYIEGGNLEVASTAALDVTAEITESSTGAIYHSPDGVYVGGGSLLVYGALDVKFTGLTNTGHDNYDKLNIRSFAVRVLNAEEVKINSGHIINGTWQVDSDGNFVLDSEKNRIPKEDSGKGGGVYVGGGTVKLGDETTKTGPTVTTTGTSKGEWVDLLEKKDYGTWDYEKNVGGGSAVSVEGGELTIYGGTYTAALGDGIFVNSGTATVKGGSFVGKGGATAGVAANYGFKMYGGTVNISGGTFGNSDSDSSGAFVMGKSSVDKATISGGTFEVGGATAFSVWQSANVEFNGGTFKGASTGLAIETHTASRTQTQITVKGGTFTANTSGNLQSGIWYGNSTSSLTITAGTFTGGTAGLYFGAVPNENNVQLSGGTYYGPDNSVYWEDRFDYGNYITTNAIAGESNLSYRTIASGCSVVGYTELGDNFSVDGARVDEDYTRSANLSNLHDKGTVTLRIDWGVIGYEVDLVFSRIEIMQQ